MQACVKVANFPFLKEVTDFDFDFQPAINKQQILDLMTLRFIENKENMKHKLPLKEVTNIEVYINQKNEFSEAAKIINNIDNLLLIKDNENYLKLTFDKGAYKKEKDFRPDLPLIINW